MCTNLSQNCHMFMYIKNIPQQLNNVTCRPITRERVSKHVSVEMDSWKPTRYGATCPWIRGTGDQQAFPWIGKPRSSRSSSRVEAGSNTSTVALRVVGGDETGSLEPETVKYCHEFHRTWIREWLRWRAPAAIVNDRSVLSSERATHINKPAAVWQ
jgi:hypothetical protein